MWKRRIASYFAVAVLAAGGLGVTAFASGEAEAADYSQQVPAFVNQVSVWKPRSKASYAYTDLDQNGSLEIITSYTSNKGAVSNGLWELRDGRLTECALPWGDDEDETELKEQQIPVYYDAREDIYYYVFGTADEGAPVTAIWLKDGALNAEVLQTDVQTRFAGMVAMTGTIGWISTAEHSLNDAPLEQLTELAGESVSGFKLTADGSASGEASN